jgi:phage shock protein PspC (stress-responsive transcriptional regulator)
MKKTLTVNISGIVFHIDEDAYNVLNNYLESIRAHFSRTRGGDEIVSDIESRIAEMLKERIGDDRQVITIDDIEVVIDTIGQPSEFGEEFTADEDPAENTGYARTGKRLFRDPENSILGGVCGGLGAYFHTDPVWFRIAFVLLCIPGIGTPLLVYVLLWIVIPEARTATERLQMRGEKVNISNIEKSIREEINHLRNKFNDFTRGARRTYKKKSEAYRPDFQPVGQALGRVAELFVRVVLIFAGIVLFLIGLSFLIALLTLIFGFGYNIYIMDSELVYISFRALTDFFIGPPGSSIFFQIAVLLLIGLPLLMLLYAGVRLVFNLPRTRFIGLSALNLWVIALIVTAFYSFKVVRSFSETAVYKEKMKTELTEDRFLKMEVAENESFNQYYRYEEFVRIEDHNMIITSERKDFFYGIPKLEIEKHNGSTVEVEVFYQARGKSEVHAQQRAQETLYNYDIEGSVLTFDRFFKLPDYEIWRDQQVEIVVKLPVGTRVYLTENMHTIINDFRHAPYRLSGESWEMTESGLEETEPVPMKYWDKRQENPLIEPSTEEDENGEQTGLLGVFYLNILRFFGYTA